MTAFLDLLDERERRSLLEKARPRIYAPGEQLITEGDREVRLILVRSGSARVEKTHLGTGVPINRVVAGEVLGELCFVDGYPASASVIADTEVEADVLDGADVERLLAADPALAARLHRALAITLAGRLRNADRARSALPVLGIG